MELDDFLQSMRAAGGLDSSGRFTVAGKEAAARFATFADSIPHFILLRLVQAAVCAGAETLLLDERGLEIRFLGGEWKPADLHLLTHDLGRAITAPEHSSLHHLAVAVAAGLRSGDVSLHVPSGAQLGLTFPVAVPYAQLGVLTAAPLRLRLTSLRLGGLVNYESPKPTWKLPDGTLAELVRGRPVGHGVAPMSVDCALYPPPGSRPVSAWTGLILRQWQDLGDNPVLVNDDAHGAGLTLSVPRTHLALCVGPKPGPTRINLVKYGVIVHHRTLFWDLPIPKVFVEADDLPVDLSGLKAVENSALDARFKALKPVLQEALADAATHLATLKPPAGGAPEWFSYACMAAGLGLGLLTWQPAFPIAGMALSGALFGHGGHRQQMVQRTSLLARVLSAPR